MVFRRYGIPFAASIISLTPAIPNLANFRPRRISTKHVNRPCYDRRTAIENSCRLVLLFILLPLITSNPKFPLFTYSSIHLEVDVTILRAVCLSMTLVLKESNPLKINGWKEFGGDTRWKGRRIKNNGNYRGEGSQRGSRCLVVVHDLETRDSA